MVQGLIGPSSQLVQGVNCFNGSIGPKGSISKKYKALKGSLLRLVQRSNFTNFTNGLRVQLG